MFVEHLKSDAAEEQLQDLITSKVDVNSEIEYDEVMGPTYYIHIASRLKNLKAIRLLLKVKLGYFEITTLSHIVQSIVSQ